MDYHSPRTSEGPPPGERALLGTTGAPGQNIQPTDTRPTRGMPFFR